MIEQAKRGTTWSRGYQRHVSTPDAEFAAWMADRLAQLADGAKVKRERRAAVWGVARLAEAEKQRDDYLADCRREAA